MQRLSTSFQISSKDGEFLLLDELQLRYTAALPCRMRAYAALAEERYKLPVYPMLINFLPPARTVTIASHYQSQALETLSETLLDFVTMADLVTWLDAVDRTL